jgi:hypothetical protein
MSTPATPSDPLFTSFLALLLKTLAKMVPGAEGDPNAGTARLNIARILFLAFKPRDAMEAMLAARAVAAHLATQDAYVRAAQPGVSDEKATRLRANAIAASRSFDVVLRTLEKLRKPTTQPPASLAKSGNAARGGLTAPAYARQQQPPAAALDLPLQIPGFPHVVPRRPASYRDSTSLTSMQSATVPVA